jgi:O-antigen/teichoic acid export membrane protein
MTTEVAEQGPRFDRHLTRGAFVNVLGTLAKLIQPLLFVLLTWMFGPSVMGVYFLTTSIGDMATSAVTSGYIDATLIYGSHHADRARDDESAARALYQVLGNAFAFAFGTGVICVALAQVGAGWLVERLYPAHPEVAPALRLLAWSLPFAAFSTTAVSATKIHMRMEYDAGIMALGRPLLQLLGCTIAWLCGAGLVGLMAATLVTQIAVAALAAWAFLRHFDGRRALRATLRPEFHREMLGFAIPQSLNMTLNKYVTRLDVVLLAKFGEPPHMLAYYSTAALITSNLREVRLIFASALAPVAARYHGTGERALLEYTLGRVSRWTTTLIVPLLLLLVVLRNDVLQVVNRSYAHGATFMVLLLVPPFLNCAFGLAGNLITYAGRSGWTLTNSALIAVLNTGLCMLLIPRYGLIGAALATALAMTMISLLEVIELRCLEGLVIRLRAVYKPYVALLVCALAVMALWDPADLPNLALRLFTAAGLLALYVAVLYLLRHEELLALLARLRSRASRTLS